MKLISRTSDQGSQTFAQATIHYLQLTMTDLH